MNGAQFYQTKLVWKGWERERKMSGAGFTESVVEEEALPWFEERGYRIVNGPTIARSRLRSMRSSWLRLSWRTYPCAKS